MAEKLATGGREGASRPGRVQWCTGVCFKIANFRQGKQRIGMNAGDGSSLREGHRDCGWRNISGEVRDDQDIKGTDGEEGRLQFAAEFFDRGANGFITIMGIAEQPLAGVGGVADLMAIERHGTLPLSRGKGRNIRRVRPWEEVVKTKKEEISRWERFTWGRKIPI